MKLSTCNDPALVTSRCFRLETRRFTAYLWWRRFPRIQIMRQGSHA